MKNKRLISIAILVLAMVLLTGCGSSAGKYHKEGLKYFSSGNYEKAEEYFAKALQLNGDRAEYYIDYGMALIQLGKYEEAISNFDRVILDKDSTIVRKNNKKAYRAKGIAYFKKHDYSTAIQFFDKALDISELSSLNLDILYYKADSQVKAGLFDKAIDTYSTIIKNKSSDADAYCSRAYAYKMLKNYEKSLKDYDKAIKLDNKNFDCYIGKYFLLLDMGYKEKATAVLGAASNIETKTKEDNFNLAKIHYYMGDYENAIEEFGEAHKNGFAEAYYFLGSIYEQKKEYKKAVNNYSKYIKEETYIPSAAVYNGISYCLIQLENYEEALSYIESGLKYNDTEYNQPLKRNEIIIYENLGNFQKAASLMKDYLKLYPDDEDAGREYEFIKTRLPEVSTPHEE